MIYEIHPCRPDEKRELQQFIQEHWKPNHALVVSDALLDFQHRDAVDGSYHFLLARNTRTGEIDGVFGYIPPTQFDPSLADNGTFFGAIWKVRDDVQNDEIKLLGTFLWKRLTRMPGFTHYGVSGISAIARAFYRVVRLQLGYLRQYYVLNRETTEFRIARIPAVAQSGVTATTRTVNATGVTIRNIALQQAQGVRYPYFPRKSLDYLRARYENHPYYRYAFRGVFDGERLCGVLVTRTLEVNGARCLRIVDIYGDVAQFPPLDEALQELLTRQGAEYIDCMNYGIAPEQFHRLGFSELDPEATDLVIPNYFEPFEQRNVKLECVHTPCDEFVIFKGDGDQDRPNILPAPESE